jgi:alkanesulfonate monooxygenase SsuD/methylene tetrahydromethanopterin reductase-like flavin-dependent oxidoreductase (luciferase family)
VRGISVVPKPYTKPHPQLFQAFGASPRTLEWCGQENVTPTILAGPMQMVHQLAEAYREGARSRGRNPQLGEGVGLCRTIHFTNNKNDIYDIVDKYEAPVWTGWYAPFGFMESSRLPGEEGPVPKPGEHLADRLIKSGLLITGTVDDVKKQMEKLLEEIPLEYLVWLFHWGLIPRDEALNQLELFATKIMPEFGLTKALA